MKINKIESVEAMKEPPKELTIKAPWGTIAGNLVIVVFLIFIQFSLVQSSLKLSLHCILLKRISLMQYNASLFENRECNFGK